MPQEQVRIKNIEDLYYYYDLIDKSQVEEQTVEIALQDFINNFDMQTSYKDSLDRLRGHIDSDIANAIIKFQEFINITYKVVKYQDQDIELSQDELNSIKIYIKVEEGSSILKYAKAISKIFNQVTETMNSKEKIIFATLILSVLTGGVVVNNVATKYLDANQQVALSQQETTRQQNMIEGFTKIQSEVNRNIIYKTIDIEGKKAILEPVKRNNGVTYNITTNPEEQIENQEVIIINQLDAKEILKTTRNSSSTDILRGHFKINGILNSSTAGKVKVQISTNDNALSGTVEFNKDDEDIDFIKILRNFGEENPIELVVKTKTLKGKTSIDKIMATIGEITPE
ncbi:hypothetical protein [Aliarcobacter butzleri]|uniref:hypothetical protein n=1 Tax=Aliarcobacter butzleri TaxID=28197 RepID=UPI003AF6CE65